MGCAVGWHLRRNKVKLERDSGSTCTPGTGTARAAGRVEEEKGPVEGEAEEGEEAGEAEEEQERQRRQRKQRRRRREDRQICTVCAGLPSRLRQSPVP